MITQHVYAGPAALNCSQQYKILWDAVPDTMKGKCRFHVTAPSEQRESYVLKACNVNFAAKIANSTLSAVIPALLNHTNLTYHIFGID